MLRTLLESRSYRQPNSLGTAASAAIHLVLITTAAYGTIARARVEQDPEQVPVVLHWRQPSSLAAPVAHRSRSVGVPGNIHVVKAPSLSIDIPAAMPDVNIPLGAIRRDDFNAIPGFTEGTGNPGTSLGSGDKSGPYDSYEVDIPVTALGGVAPAYPPAMRASAVEGEVKAEFVVDKNGHADPASLRIISTTNELFSESVRSALPRMRFKPARLRGEPVAQLVQQLFVFRLSR